MPDLRANSVEVVKLSQARCRLADCDWRGDLRSSYQEANEDRQQHLEHHRRGGGPIRA